MKTLYDRILILLLCCAQLSFTGDDAALVISGFAAVAFSALAMYFEKRPASLILCLTFSAACLADGSLCLMFYPLAVYELAYSQTESASGRILINARLLYIPSGLLYFLILLNFYDASPAPLLMLYAFAAAYMAVRSSIRAQTDNELLCMKDARRELELLIAQRQRDSMHRQEYEAHVATLRERNRIAREIHDNVGHLLSRSLLMVGALKARCRDESLMEPLADLRETLSGAMDSIRNSVHGLHDESVDLEDNIRTLLKSFSFCPVTLDYDMSRNVSRDVKYCFLSIVKEALSNIARHSNATKAGIVLREHEKLYQLLIDDNGTSASGTADESRGIGLENMRERVAALGGTIYFSSHSGFRIFVTVPKQRKDGQ